HPLEGGEIGAHVDREAVRRHAAGDPNADRRDLRRQAGARQVDPDTGLAAFGPRADPVRTEHLDERTFEGAHVAHEIGRVAEAHHRITDELTGTVISDVAAAIDAVHRRSGATEL